MGVSGLCLAVTSPFWGSLTHRYSPKALYLKGMFAHSIAFLLMGFTTDLYLLFALRVMQGIFGGISAIGLVLVTASSPAGKASSNLGFYQSSLTLGQLAGPPPGTLAVAALGYRGAFVTASAMLFASPLSYHFYVTDIKPPPAGPEASLWPRVDRKALVAWTLCLMVQMQIMFLPGILPQVLQGFRMKEGVRSKGRGENRLSWLGRLLPLAGLLLVSLTSKKIVRYTAHMKIMQIGLNTAGAGIWPI